MTSANEDGAVQAALQEALKGTTVDPQSTEEPSLEVKPEEKVASEAKADSTQEVKEPKDGPKSVPYDRFSEVVGQKNEALDKIKSLESQFDGVSKREETLRERVGDLETDHQIVKAIRDLGQDDRYRPHVVALDKALQGVKEEEVAAEESGSSDTTELDKAKAALNEKVAALETLVSEQTTERLWEQTDKYAIAMLDTLPEEYSDVDKGRLSKLWISEVDWDAIEKGGREAIPGHLESSFAKLIKDYGPPQGTITKNVKLEIAKDHPEVTEKTTPEGDVKLILAEDWSARDEDGKAVHSDEDFKAAAANLIRKTRLTH